MINMVNNLLYGLTEQDYIWLYKHGEVKQIPKDKTIVSIGKSLQEIYIVIEGTFLVGNEKGNSFLTVGKGGLLGSLTFLTKEITTLSIKALKNENTLLIIQHDSLHVHINEDPDFGMRFYRALAYFLGDSLKKTLHNSVMGKDIVDQPYLIGPRPILNNNQPNFSYFKKTICTLVPLAKLIKDFNNNQDISEEMMKRDKLLSVATVQSSSILLLAKIARQVGLKDLDERIILHEPTITAEEKQAQLPNYLIQKTITILINGKLVLCSNFNLNVTHDLLSSIGDSLGIKQLYPIYINPTSFIPEIELGLLRGMVSTFIAPNRISRLHLICVIISDQDNIKNEVAVSLSPIESVLIPKELFAEIVKQYGKFAYPYIDLQIQKLHSKASD